MNDADRRALLASLRGVPFTKMTGSGNDFVLFDAQEIGGAPVTQPDAVQAICNRFNGIGADGVVLLEPRPEGANARIRYFNSDGTAADLCGNATLCSTAMTVELSLGEASGLRLWTDAGLITSRVDATGTPEIDLAPVTDIRLGVPIETHSGERRIGFALTGVPHLVVLVDNVATVDLMHRGAELRHNAATGSAGANVNFVAEVGDGTWRYRTFERGVEGETLACGTGAVATALVLGGWGLAASPVTIRTSSNRRLIVSFSAQRGEPGAILPSLRGEGRVVFRGRIHDLTGSEQR